MLSIRNLSHTYANGVKALQDIHLDIPKGMFGLLGPNGAGKSSLMRTLATLQQPTTGQIRFGDIDVLSHPQALRQQLGYLPQDFGVYPRGSAYDLLDHLAILKGVVHAKTRKVMVDRLLVETNLYQARHRRLATFSGGMRQRFGIAQALLGKPQLIIVDEPTGGLDPAERNRFHNLLAEIGEEVVVILSTHIVEDVAHLCRRMAILAAGKVVQMGEPAHLAQSLTGRIWQKPIPRSELPAYRAKHRVIADQLSSGQTLIRVFAETQPDPHFQSAKPTLADVYFVALFEEHADSRSSGAGGHEDQQQPATLRRPGQVGREDTLETARETTRETTEETGEKRSRVTGEGAES